MATNEPTASTTRDGNTATVRIAGYLSAAAEPVLAPAFAAAAAAAKVLVLFAPDANLNSDGIGLLLAEVLRLRRQGREVRVDHPAPEFRRLFDLLGLGGRLAGKPLALKGYWSNSRPKSSQGGT